MYFVKKQNSFISGSTFCGLVDFFIQRNRKKIPIKTKLEMDDFPLISLINAVI